jgi:hypothetical protein
VSARSSLITLISNYACDVGQRGDRRLYCNCTGLVVTTLFAVGAVICLASVVAFSMLVAAGGNPAKGAVGALMGSAMAVAMGTLAMRRYDRHGRFVIDGEQAVLKRYRGNTMVGEYSFRDVLRVWTVDDLTDGMMVIQLTPPSWLQIATRSGEVFRVAKGTRQELAPVCEALRRMGLAFDKPRLD